MTDLLLQTWPARLARDAWSAVTLPGDVYAGRVTPNDSEFYERATDLAGLVMSSTLAAPRGALGAGATRPPRRLPTDVESRMQRARDMGFDTDARLYHGTDKEFGAFDLSKAGSATGTPMAKAGVWTTSNPKIADEFARRAARQSEGYEQVYPLLHKPGRNARYNLEGDESLRFVDALINHFWDQGYDSVTFRNAPTPNRELRGETLIVRNPNQLRSPQAAFDPSRRKSSNLLAGIGAAASLPQLFTESDGAEDF